LTGFIYGLATPHGRVRLGYAISEETLEARWRAYLDKTGRLEVVFAQAGESTKQALDLFQVSAPLVTLTPAERQRAYERGVCPDAKAVLNRVIGSRKPRPIPFWERAPLTSRHSTIQAVLSGKPLSP
jgi:hypothetical protein